MTKIQAHICPSLARLVFFWRKLINLTPSSQRETTIGQSHGIRESNTPYLGGLAVFSNKTFGAEGNKFQRQTVIFRFY